MTPQPLRNFHKWDNPPGKVHFHEERLLRCNVKEWGHLIAFSTVFVRNGFHLLSDRATLKHVILPQSNLICKFAYP